MVRHSPTYSTNLIFLCRPFLKYRPRLKGRRGEEEEEIEKEVEEEVEKEEEKEEEEVECMKDCSRYGI